MSIVTLKCEYLGSVFEWMWIFKILVNGDLNENASCWHLNIEVYSLYDSHLLWIRFVRQAGIFIDDTKPAKITIQDKNNYRLIFY